MVSPGKRVASKYSIQLNPHYKQKILTGFRGHGSAEFFRQYTSELWDAEFGNLTCAQYGAFRRILSMFMRDKNSIRDGLLTVTLKELKNHGISRHLLEQISHKNVNLSISLLTESGQIRDLRDVCAAREGEGEGEGSTW